MDIYTGIVTQTSQENLILPQLESDSGNQSENEIYYLDLSYRYEILSDSNVGEIKPFFEVEDKKFYSLTIKDIKPSLKYSLDAILENVEGIDRQSLIDAGVPAIAFPYLTLAEFCPTIPELYDGWKNEETNQEFVVISQPESWQLLSDVLEKQDIPFLQTVSYLDKIAKLWKPLRKVHSCETLLRTSNIGLDEDDTLVIRQILPDESDSKPDLEKLLNVFLELLPSSSEQETQMVLQLLDLLNTGKIKNAKELRSNMQTLSQEIQLNSLLTEDEDNDLEFIAPEEELQEISEQFDFEEDEENEDDEATLISSDVDNQPTVVLPMELLSLVDAGMTDIGNRRTHNEDCFAVDTNISKQETPQGIKCKARGLYLVCDGMGGHAAGEVASAMAVKNIYQYFQDNWKEELPDVDVIKQGIINTNSSIYNANMKKGGSGNQRMGTTMVLALVEGTKVAIAHVGDSRIYKVTRKWGLEKLTTDHSVAQMEIKKGVEAKLAYGRVDAYQLTQALGPRDNEFVHPDVKILEVKEDTLFLLCSDGLCDNDLLEDNWQNYLSPLISSNANLNEGLSQIIDLGNQVNGHDNITCILVRVKVQPHLENKKPLL